MIKQLELFPGSDVMSEKWVISLQNNLWDEENQCFSHFSLLSVKIFPTEKQAQKYYEKHLKKTLKKKKISTIYGEIRATELIAIRLMKESELKLLSIQRGEIER